MRGPNHNALVGVFPDETITGVADVLVAVQAMTDTEGPGDAMWHGVFLILDVCVDALRYEAEHRGTRRWSRPDKEVGDATS